MTSVWLVTRPDYDGDNIQGVYASMDAVRAAFPALEWEDISGEHGQEWRAIESAGTASSPWENEYRAELLTVIE